MDVTGVTLSVCVTMYQELAEIPIPTFAQFTTPSSLRLTFSKRDRVKNVKQTLSKTVRIGSGLDIGDGWFEDVADDVVLSALSPSRTLRAVLRETKSSPAKRWIEIWRQDRLLVLRDVTHAHGQFYSDEFLSSLQFSPLESSLLYIAEQNSPSTDQDPFAKFRYTPSFGEGLSSFKRPAIFILAWSSESQSRLYQLSPIPTETPNITIHFGQAAFSPSLGSSEIYATGYETTQDGRLLGIKYCLNRPFGIWRIPFSLSHQDTSNDRLVTLECTAHKLTPSTLSCRSPRTFLSPSGPKLVYLSSPSGGPHLSTSSLHLVDLSSPSLSTKTLVDTILEPGPDGFPGLYPSFSLLPSPSFLVSHPTWDEPRIITQSTWGSRTAVILISTKDGSVVNLTPQGNDIQNWTVLTVDNDNRKGIKIAFVASLPSSPHQVILGTLDPTILVIKEWRVVHKPTISEEATILLQALHTSIVSVPIPDQQPIEMIIVHPSLTSSREESPSQCIFIPHGGPHSASTTEFVPLNVGLALEGYTLALPNYTGSTGFGDSFLRRLIGRCGELDIEECMHAFRFLTKLGLAKEGETFIMGGSHGGFIGAHLVGRHPDTFAAAVLRNPVISVGEVGTSDIPDWYYAEFGFGDQYPVSLDSSPPKFITQDTQGEVRTQHKHTGGAGMKPEIYAKLYASSPIRYAQAVTAPVLLLVGRDDQRVAPMQGVGYYHALRAAGATSHAAQGKGMGKGKGKVEMLVFDGEGHPLDGVGAASVSWEAAKGWFESVLKEKERD
ncbi:hypothetical protein AX17_002255 [Amanita inopinata Kibby_2008]|nr:hypothetical protein AX17_002255 [Amanita inopinata Kibby_2008]